ncbi:MAG: hypothetical protein R2738_04790 [Bacteroides graminisolvens]
MCLAYHARESHDLNLWVWHQGYVAEVELDEEVVTSKDSYADAQLTAFSCGGDHTWCWRPRWITVRERALSGCGDADWFNPVDE